MGAGFHRCSRVVKHPIELPCEGRKTHRHRQLAQAKRASQKEIVRGTQEAQMGVWAGLEIPITQTYKKEST